MEADDRPSTQNMVENIGAFISLAVADSQWQADDHQYQEERRGEIHLRWNEHGWREGERDCRTHCAR